MEYKKEKAKNDKIYVYDNIFKRIIARAYKKS